MSLLTDPEWWERARCAERDVDPEIFMPRQGAFAFSQARKICGNCPVQTQCLTTTLSIPPYGEDGRDHMFVAGYTPEELFQLRRRMEKKSA